MAIINIMYSKCISINSICLHYVFKSHKLISCRTTMGKMKIHLVRGSENRSQSVTHSRQIANIFFAYISMQKSHNRKWKHTPISEKNIIARTSHMLSKSCELTVNPTFNILNKMLLNGGKRRPQRLMCAACHHNVVFYQFHKKIQFPISRHHNVIARYIFYRQR